MMRYLRIQPFEYDKNNILRFTENKIVVHLLNCASMGIKCDLNDIAKLSFSDIDVAQFRALIGYSLSSYGGMSDLQGKIETIVYETIKDLNKSEWQIRAEIAEKQLQDMTPLFTKITQILEKFTKNET